MSGVALTMADELPWAKSPYWMIDPPEDYSKFFAELPSIRFPSGCFALLEGTSLADSILMLLQPFLIEHKLGRRFLFLQSSNSRRYRVPLDAKTFSSLSTISSSLAGPEICNEFLVFLWEGLCTQLVRFSLGSVLRFVFDPGSFCETFLWRPW